MRLLILVVTVAFSIGLSSASASAQALDTASVGPGGSMTSTVIVNSKCEMRNAKRGRTLRRERQRVLRLPGQKRRRLTLDPRLV